MEELTSVSGAASIRRAELVARNAQGTPEGAPRVQREGDRVEVSDMARLMQRLRDTPEIREDLVARIRAEIDAGTYETAEKLSSAIDAMIADADSDL